MSICTNSGVIILWGVRVDQSSGLARPGDLTSLVVISELAVVVYWFLCVVESVQRISSAVEIILRDENISLPTHKSESNPSIVTDSNPILQNARALNTFFAL